MIRPGEQAIKCNVAACRYNDRRQSCGLSAIVVGEDGGGVFQKTDTLCSNFTARLV